MLGKRQRAAPRVKKQQVNAGPAQHGELLHTLSLKRKAIKEETSVDIDEKIRVLRDEVERSQNKRWLVRKVLDMQDQIQELVNEKQRIDSGQKLGMFDEEMAPVMQRLRAATDRRNRTMLEDAEREVRRKLTCANEPIALQHAILADMCDDCGIPMRVIANDSLLGCPQCAKTRVIPMVSSAAAESEYAGTVVYHQKSRLLEWLEFCQGKEYAEPVPEILDLVMEQLVADKATGLEEFMNDIATERANGPFKHADDAIARLSGTIPHFKHRLLSIKASTVRSAMQAVAASRQDERLRKFYERSPKYAAYISGYWPLRFSNSQEESIRKMYSIAAPAYEKYRKPTQPNWPGGYAYFLRCLCILMGWDEFLDHFTVVSGPKNMVDREAIRQKIWTEDLGWEYVSSATPRPLK
jgi:hypothetical protein